MNSSTLTPAVLAVLILVVAFWSVPALTQRAALFEAAPLPVEREVTVRLQAGVR